MTRDRRNRRAPEARYVRFHDVDGMQPRFVDLAEDAYTRLARADAWTTEASIDLPVRAAAARRGLFRRASDSAAGSTTPTTVTLVLAEAHRVALAVPASMDALDGCVAGRRLASLMGGLLCDLVRNLAALTGPEQKAHADYRQMMRLTAELTALAEVTETRGCRDRNGCVVLRVPEPGGRREEDAEVTRIRAVLLRRAKAGR